MTQAKAQTVASAIIGAGFEVAVRHRDDGEWVVRARSAAMDISVASANNLAIAQAVSGTIAEAEYV